MRTYECDEENQLTLVRRASDEELLRDVTYDALGRRIETIDTTRVSDPCGDESSPVVNHAICNYRETSSLWRFRGIAREKGIDRGK